MDDRPIVVITSRGHKSGKLRKNPVMRVEHEGVYAAIASKGGAPEHPEWFHNFTADPHVDLQDGPEPHSYVARLATARSEEHTSELQSLMRISYAVFCLKKKKTHHIYYTHLYNTTTQQHI